MPTSLLADGNEPRLADVARPLNVERELNLEFVALEFRSGNRNFAARFDQVDEWFEVRGGRRGQDSDPLPAYPNLHQVDGTPRSLLGDHVERDCYRRRAIGEKREQDVHVIFFAHDLDRRAGREHDVRDFGHVVDWEHIVRVWDVEGDSCVSPATRLFGCPCPGPEDQHTPLFQQMANHRRPSLGVVTGQVADVLSLDPDRNCTAVLAVWVGEICDQDCIGPDLGTAFGAEAGDVPEYSIKGLLTVGLSCDFEFRVRASGPRPNRSTYGRRRHVCGSGIRRLLATCQPTKKTHCSIVPATAISRTAKAGA